LGIFLKKISKKAYAQYVHHIVPLNVTASGGLLGENVRLKLFIMAKNL